MKLLHIFLQQIQETQAATEAVGNNKLGVVVVVICVLFAGMVAYLVSLDRKIRKLEK